MFSFLVWKLPPRTQTAHLNPIHLDDGQSTVEYLPKSSRYLVINRLPPNIPGKPLSSLSPPLHWHYDQDETFQVLEGKARFRIDGKDVEAGPGQEISIPQGSFHTFRNASSTERMVIQFVLEPKKRKRDETFFRNIQSYRDDCRRTGTPRNLPQVLLFMYSGGVVMALPGPRILAKTIGLLLNLVGGLVIGKWLLGYSDSYPEYYRENID